MSDKTLLLLELASQGNVGKLTELLESNEPPDVNFQHSINRWTALHWACHRDQPAAVQVLLNAGADPGLSNGKGQRPVDLCQPDGPCLAVFSKTGCRPDASKRTQPVQFQPNYLRNPVFPYSVDDDLDRPTKRSVDRPLTSSKSGNNNAHTNSGRVCVLAVLKTATFPMENDFIEVEVDRQSTSFKQLVEQLKTDLFSANSISGRRRQTHQVVKVRKLPNVVLWRDADVKRLRNGDRLQLVCGRGQPVGLASFDWSLLGLVAGAVAFGLIVHRSFGFRR